MRDQDELGVLLHALQHLDEPADVGVIQRRVDFVEQAEGAWTVFEDGEHQSHRGERLFAARQELDALKPFSRRLRDDVDTAFELVAFVEQHKAGAAAAEKRRERLLEILIDDGKRFFESFFRGLVDPANRLPGRGNRIDQILALRRQERVSRLEIVELINGHHVDRAHAFDLVAQVANHLVGGHYQGDRRGPLLCVDADRRFVFDLGGVGGVVHRLGTGKNALALQLGDFRRDFVERNL